MFINYFFVYNLLKKKKRKKKRVRKRKMSTTISVGTMNLDWTNRSFPVRSSVSLEFQIKSTLERFNFPDIFGFSEVATKAWIKPFTKSSPYTGAIVGGSYEKSGYFYIAWNREKVRLVDMAGSGPTNRFAAAYLHHTPTDRIVLFIVVHMPREKVKWREEADAIIALIRTRSHDSQVVIAGDFNATLAEIALKFASLGFNCAIRPYSNAGVTCSDMYCNGGASCKGELNQAGKSGGETTTTKAGNSIDNILSNSGFGGPRVIVDKLYGYFSHYPLMATVLSKPRLAPWQESMNGLQHVQAFTSASGDHLGGSEARSSTPSRDTTPTGSGAPAPAPSRLLILSCSLLVLSAAAAVVHTHTQFFH